MMSSFESEVFALFASNNDISTAANVKVQLKLKYSIPNIKMGIHRSFWLSSGLVAVNFELQSKLKDETERKFCRHQSTFSS